MRQARAWWWPGAFAGLVLWAGCNQILGTGEPMEVSSSGNGGSGGTTGSNQGGAGACADDGDIALAFPVNPDTADKRFAPATAAGYIEDKWTKVLWNSVVMGSAMAGEAADNCILKDDRLPTRLELLSIVNYDAAPNALFYPLFGGTEDIYWTSTKSADGKPWGVDFSTGEAGTHQDTTLGKVRCVKK